MTRIDSGQRAAQNDTGGIDRPAVSTAATFAFQSVGCPIGPWRIERDYGQASVSSSRRRNSLAQVDDPLQHAGRGAHFASVRHRSEAVSGQ